MLKLVRVLIDAITDGPVKIFTGTGHAGQKMKGEFWQQYGLTSRPMEGSHGTALTLPNGMFLICTADKQRYVEVADGEVCLHASTNVKIHLKADDTLEIDCAGLTARVHGDLTAEVKGGLTATISGNLAAKVDGSTSVECKDISLKGDGKLEKMLKGESVFQWLMMHVHGGNLGAPTTPPQVPLVDTVHLSQEVKNT